MFWCRVRSLSHRSRGPYSCSPAIDDVATGGFDDSVSKDSRRRRHRARPDTRSFNVPIQLNDFSLSLSWPGQEIIETTC